MIVGRNRVTQPPIKSISVERLHGYRCHWRSVDKPEGDLAQLLVRQSACLSVLPSLLVSVITPAELTYVDEKHHRNIVVARKCNNKDGGNSSGGRCPTIASTRRLRKAKPSLAVGASQIQRMESRYH